MEGWILVGLGEDAALSKGGPAPGPGSLEIPGSLAGHGRGGALVHAAPALRGAVARAAESAFELLSPTRCCGCERLGPVSYTHLDVYKRQGETRVRGRAG